MPIRIYDISKKLGLENKEVISKAKALGIASAKVPSSMLDKITGEYLEEELLKDHPEIAKKLASAKAVAPVIPRAAPSKPPIPVPNPTRLSPTKPPPPRDKLPIQIGKPQSRVFEETVRQFMDRHIPHATLSNILIFNAAIHPIDVLDSRLSESEREAGEQEIRRSRDLAIRRQHGRKCMKMEDA